MAGRPNVEPFTLKLPEELPPLNQRAARALLELVEALAAVELDDDQESAA